MVKVDRVGWMEIADQQSVVNALTASEVQVVTNIGADDMDMMRGRHGIKLRARLANNSLSLRMNWLRPPFNNLKVRQAVLHAASRHQSTSCG